MDTDHTIQAEVLGQALRGWRGLLGEEHVLVSDDILTRYARTCIPQSNRPLAVLRPAAREDVVQILRIASAHRIPLYPISCGKNWGYGSASPTTKGQVIVDLGRLNRIIEVNNELAYAVIEPGVTQGQLYERLHADGDVLMLDVTGAGPEASIVGNALERGFGHTPYGDRFGHTCGMEIVLADGRVLNTGFGAYENAKASRVFPRGVGPWIDGLFTQSNFGIVTRLGLWLMPRPDACQAFGFTVEEYDKLGEIVETLRKLHLHGVVNSHIHIANDLRVLSSRMNYPWHLTGGVTPLPNDIRHRLRRDAALGAWNVLGGVYGTKRMVTASRREISRAFRGLARIRFFDKQTIGRLKKVASVLGYAGMGRNLRETLANASNVYDLITGIPSSDHLKGLGWRSKNIPENAEPTDFGGLWLSPIIPMTAEASRDLVSIIESTFAKYEFDPLLTFTTVNSRSLCCVLTIAYDKLDHPERVRATECYDELLDHFFQLGFIPYRVGIQAMHKLAREPSVFWDVCQDLKKALDPNAVLAPGRYISSSHRI